MSSRAQRYCAGADGVSSPLLLEGDHAVEQDHGIGPTSAPGKAPQKADPGPDAVVGPVTCEMLWVTTSSPTTVSVTQIRTDLAPSPMTPSTAQDHSGQEGHVGRELNTSAST